jgi:hypothetical protein
MEPYDLDLRYIHFTDIRYGSVAIAENDAMWKWRKPGPGELEKNEFRIARLLNDSMAVVFSINRPIELLDAATPFRLKDTQSRVLEAVRLDSPRLFEGGLISKAGSNDDSVYYARMRSPELTFLPGAIQQKGKVYYRLVIGNDSIRSELSPYPIQLAPEVLTANVDSVKVNGVPTLAPPASPSTYNVPYVEYNSANPASTGYTLGFSNASNLFDHYIDVDTNTYNWVKILSSDSIIRVFGIDTNGIGSATYVFPVEVFKLLKDGTIHKEDITIEPVF